ncbi:WASH complex subunit 3 [Ctenocephalides felis]|uniref:WASH complex subunit 3 n=1 Tax=Ctenocephalides felis TaxID=7515 RepID=UPI000E6E3594|nr:WASH complex subunit 3 [Ctenocephalides felis]
MSECGLPIIGPDVELAEVAPLNPKRTLAFVNHFLIKTVTFINNFANVCESHFIEFERKIQKLEASLIILESKLSSIPGLDDNSIKPDILDIETQNKEHLDLPDIATNNISVDDNKVDIPEIKENCVRACDDIRYKRFFKMLQFGVPAPAVKQKMQVDGLDPNILDDPNQVLSDGCMEEVVSSSDSDD